MRWKRSLTTGNATEISLMDESTVHYAPSLHNVYPHSSSVGPATTEFDVMDGEKCATRVRKIYIVDECIHFTLFFMLNILAFSCCISMSLSV